jgi:hypothetical protein
LESSSSGSGGGGGGGRVAVEITFEVKFIKPTMFKYVIESNTNTEMTKWLEAFHFALKANISSAKSSGLVTSSSVDDVEGSGGAGGVKGNEGTDKRIKKRSHKKINPTIKRVIGRGENLVIFFDSLLERFGIVGGVVFWSAWALLVLSLLFYGWQWRGVAVKIEYMRLRWGGVVRLMNKIVETQDALNTSMSAQIALMQSFSINSNGKFVNGEIHSLMQNLSNITACTSSSTSSSPSFDQGNVSSLARALSDISQSLKVVSDEVERLKRSKPHS